MSITPQAIKDQEFQVKFRGYDAIEVKAYLELLAEEFFELHETRRRQEEEFEELTEENRKLKEEKDELFIQSSEREGDSESDKELIREKDLEIGSLKTRIAELESASEEAQQDLEHHIGEWDERESELKEKIQRLEDQYRQEQGTSTEARNDADKLRDKISMLETQIETLKKEEVDFKSTIVAAQKFADDVRAKAEEEAAALLEDAREDVESFRREAEQTLSDLPLEIEELKEKKSKVREELRGILNSYLKHLEDTEDVEEPADVEELSDLFQSINLTDEENGEPNQE